VAQRSGGIALNTRLPGTPEGQDKPGAAALDEEKRALYALYLADGAAGGVLDHVAAPRTPSIAPAGRRCCRSRRSSRALIG